jgi:hypothetical protein
VITIFGTFWRKNCRFFQNQFYDKILHSLALYWIKNAIFSPIFFGENIFKIITSVPGDRGFFHNSANSSLFNLKIYDLLP